MKTGHFYFGYLGHYHFGITRLRQYPNIEAEEAGEKFLPAYRQAGTTP